MNPDVADTIELHLLTLDESVQARERIDAATVSEYAERVAAGGDLPPVAIVWDGHAYYVWDGFHRVLAYLEAGRVDIPAVYQKGTLSDAQWLAVTANATHGLRRSNADKRRAIKLALLHPKGKKKSDRAIADHVGVSPPTVASVRAELEAGVKVLHLESRVGQDGKTYPAKRTDTAAAETAHVDETGVPVWTCAVCGKTNTDDRDDCTWCGSDRSGAAPPDDKTADHTPDYSGNGHAPTVSDFDRLDERWKGAMRAAGIAPDEQQIRRIAAVDPAEVAAKTRAVRTGQQTLDQVLKGVKPARQGAAAPSPPPAASAGDWRITRAKAVKTAEALQRVIDDLHSERPDKSGHKAALTAATDILVTLRGWK